MVIATTVAVLVVVLVLVLVVVVVVAAAAVAVVVAAVVKIILEIIDGAVVRSARGVVTMWHPKTDCCKVPPCGEAGLSTIYPLYGNLFQFR